jgi:hypothetical protein
MSTQEAGATSVTVTTLFLQFFRKTSRRPATKEITRTKQSDIEWVLSLTFVKEEEENRKPKRLRWLKDDYRRNFRSPQKGLSARHDLDIN